ncbi:transposase domain-containing protein [Microtetraspora malaysiensis]|uniref:transposase domain-containing protein n=1 Tax=Microtetraspora malaysiensis TaxID=161358 RepID=UPI003D94E041
MPVPPSTETVDVDLDAGRRRRLLRELVVAGPGAALDSGAGLLTQIVPAEAITDAVHRSGHADQRRRTLTGEAIATTLLNLAMHSDEGYDSVLARTMAQLPGPRPPGEQTPTGSALSQARAGFPASDPPAAGGGHRFLPGGRAAAV